MYFFTNLKIAQISLNEINIFLFQIMTLYYVNLVPMKHQNYKNSSLYSYYSIAA